MITETCCFMKFVFLFSQAHFNLRSFRNNVVLAFKLPHMYGSTADYIKTEAQEERFTSNNKVN